MRLRFSPTCSVLFAAVFASVVWAAVCCAAIAQGRDQGDANPPEGLLDGAETPRSARPAKLPVFDVVSVRLITANVDSSSIQSPPDGDGITIHNLTLEWIIDFAYSFQRSELVSGLPEWAKTDRYDITAKVTGADLASFQKLTQDQRLLMVQALLAARFGLKAHRELREIPIYALVIAKSGPKMKQATPGDRYLNGARDNNGQPTGPGTFVGLTGQSVTMEDLAQRLTRIGVGREVVDRTGLTAKYDFTLRCAPTDAMRPVINGQVAPLTDEENALPSVFTAVQEQLGLKLEPAKGSVEGLVIDRLERPQEN